MWSRENNIGDKESSSDLETGAKPHRLELEEEFGEFLQEFSSKSLLNGETASRPTEGTVYLYAVNYI